MGVQHGKPLIYDTLKKKRIKEPAAVSSFLGETVPEKSSTVGKAAFQVVSSCPGSSSGWLPLTRKFLCLDKILPWQLFAKLHYLNNIGYPQG